MSVSVIDDMVEVWFLFGRSIKKKLLGNLLNHYLEIGCSTQQNGQEDTCKYQPPDFKEPTQTLNTEEAFNRIVSDQKGGLELWYEDIRVDLEVNLESSVFSTTKHISLKIWSSQFKDHDKDHSSPMDRVSSFLDLVFQLVDIMKPKYAFGSLYGEQDSGEEITREVLDKSGIPGIFWINLFTKDLISRIGEEKLLSAPAWKVDKISKDQILLVVTSSPLSYKQEADQIEDFLYD